MLDAVAGIAALGDEKARLVWEDTVSWEELVDMDAEEIYLRLTGGEEEMEGGEDEEEGNMQ